MIQFGQLRKNKMKLKNKNVLVVGGAGFIGSHVVSELLKTNISKVRVYDNFSRGKLEISPRALMTKDVNSLKKEATSGI